MAYKNFDVSPVAGALGAELHGLDLSKPFDEYTLKEVDQALLEYLVLFFKDQSLTPDQFKSFVRSFGEIENHPFIEKIEGDNQIESLDLARDQGIGPPTSVLHIDVSMFEIPTKGAALYAVDVGPAGGDTIWVNAYTAYDALSESMKNFLEGHRGLFPALHDKVLNQMIKTGPDAFQKAGPFMIVPSEHPLVHTHPKTGKKALFVCPLFMRSIVDLNDDESDAIIRFLIQHVSKPEFQCRYHWQNGSIALWDNLFTIHKRVDDAYDEHRVMHRLAIKGTEAPTL
jgi:taurine dioxygenase